MGVELLSPLGISSRVATEVVQATSTIVLLDIDNTLFNTPEFKRTGRQHFEAYPEVKGDLERLAKVTTLGILSQEAEPFLQGTKLIETGIASCFDEQHIHIVPNKLQAMEEILSGYKHRHVVLVDDKLTVLARAKEVDENVITVWMQRGEYANSQRYILDFQPDFVFPDIASFTEIMFLGLLR
jgi:hypothetical protein